MIRSELLRKVLWNMEERSHMHLDRTRYKHSIVACFSPHLPFCDPFKVEPKLGRPFPSPK